MKDLSKKYFEKELIKENKIITDCRILPNIDHPFFFVTKCIAFAETVTESYVIGGATNGQIWFWSLKTQNHIRDAVIFEDKNEIYAIDAIDVVICKGNMYVAVGTTWHLAVYDFTRNTVIIRFNHEFGYMRSLKIIDNQGLVVLVGDEKGNICKVQVDTKTVIIMPVIYGHTSCINVIYSPQGCKILVAKRDFAAKVVDYDTGKVEKIFRGHTGSIVSIFLLQNDKGIKLVTGSQDGRVIIWNYDTQQQEATLCMFRMPVESVEIVGGKSGLYIVVAYHEDKIVVFNAHTYEAVQIITNKNAWVKSLKEIVYENRHVVMCLTDLQKIAFLNVE